MKKVKFYTGKNKSPFQPKQRDNTSIQAAWRKKVVELNLWDNDGPKEELELLRMWLTSSITGLHSGVVKVLLGCQHTNWAYIKKCMRRLEKMLGESIIEMQVVKGNNTSFYYWTEDNWNEYKKYLDLLEVHRMAVKDKVFPHPDELNKDNIEVREESSAARAQRRKELKDEQEQEDYNTRVKWLRAFLKDPTTPLTPQAMAEIMGNSSNGARRLLKKLEAEGLIVKVREGRKGGPAALYKITKLGQGKYGELSVKKK